MDPITLGFVGSGTIDYYIPQAQIIAGDAPSFHVKNGPECFQFVSTEPVEPGAKIGVTALPPVLLAAATATVAGGGALNSLRAFAEIAPGVRARYLDACDSHEMLAAQCAGLGIEARFLGLYPVPRNAIIGMDRRDKVILKSVPSPASSVIGSAHDFQWLSECQAVVLNSSRPVGLVSQVVNLHAQGGLRLHAAITRSLPGAFVLRTVVPAASTVCANWDEVDALPNFPRVRSLRGASKALRRLKEFAPDATVFLTMGSKGVLASYAGSSHVFHVYANPDIANAVRVRVSADPTSLCGCGDSFVAGVVAAVETGRSLLTTVSAEGDPAIPLAMAGCASAIRWLAARV